MIDRHHDRTDTTLEDRASVEADAEPSVALERHPFVVGFLAVASAGIVFWLGILVGEGLYTTFDGEGLMAAVLGATLVTVLAILAATGVWLDRRRSRDVEAVRLTADQRRRLRAHLHPSSPLARWYEPSAITLFLALAVLGDRLLDAPWDAVWIVAVLVANPLGRWLRANGHVPTTRDLGFAIPGMSPWPSITVAALAATTGLGIAVLIWADALDTTRSVALTAAATGTVVIGCALAIDRHERRHLQALLDDRHA